MTKILYGTLEGIFTGEDNGFSQVTIKSSGSIERIYDMTNTMSKSKEEARDILLNNFNNYLFDLTHKGWKIKSVQMNLTNHKVYLLELVTEED